jgi:hypothetical protein
MRQRFLKTKSASAQTGHFCEPSALLIPSIGKSRVIQLQIPRQAAPTRGKVALELQRRR